MKCPVCKTECGDAMACPECGFEDLNPTFLSKEEGEAWIENVVWPYRKKYWVTLPYFKINNTTLIKADRRKKQYKIPYGITHIGAEAFGWCKRLRNVQIPNSVVSIGEAAFWLCSKLESVVVPDSVVDIGDQAFEGCFNLRQIMLPKYVRSWGYGVINRCGSLEKMLENLVFHINL